MRKVHFKELASLVSTNSVDLGRADVAVSLKSSSSRIPSFLKWPQVFLKNLDWMRPPYVTKMKGFA